MSRSERGRRPQANILGVGVDVVDMEEAVDRLLDAVRRRRGGYVCVRDVHGVMQAQRDPNLKGIHNRSLLTTADGMPVVWVGRVQGHRRMTRVYGPDLMLETCRRSLEAGHSHFFYGGRPGVAEDLAASLSARFPGLRVAGTYSPPFRPLTEAEETELTAQVAAARPDFFWVGLGTPKQERFMAEYIDRLDVGVMLGVGAAFDMHAGRVRQAPAWVQRIGFEWVFRMSQEPARLWRRYLVNNPLFLWNVLLHGLRLKRFELDPAPDRTGSAEPPAARRS
jgi:N-acetylglucosaminyldiphosphoundecaprenol N-acetyl-beta-D-mannosaminyltransferase